MPFEPTYKTVHNEGCDLRYWYQGAGPLLIFIAGGGGVGRQFNPIFEHLDKRYTVCTLDRRQSGDSKAQVPSLLNPSQQCRDIIAVMKDLGRDKMSIFANSGGGIIAFQLAVSYPDVLEHVIAHETPTTVLLPDCTYHLDRAFSLLEIFRSKGPFAALGAFRSEMKGFENSPERANPPSKEDFENFWENEYLTFTIYCPDLTRIVENGVSIGVAAGEKSQDAFYARTTVPQAKILRCPRFMVPGHHAGYSAEPAEFGAALIKAYEELEARSKGNN